MMSYVAILALLGYVLWITRKARVHGAQTPHTNAERAHAFAERMDAAIGLSSEPYQEQLAKGIRVKALKLGRIDHIAATTSRFKDSYRFGAVDCVTTLHDGKQIFSVLQVKPLRMREAPLPALQIITKRPRLSLAR